MEPNLARAFRLRRIAVLLLVLAASVLPSLAGNAPKVESLDIAPVWSGHPVGFALLTHDDQQFVAYYDALRRMTLAQRTLGDTKWRFKILPSTVGWDSHNYVTLALDANNCLHVSGNMHAVPLVYFRGNRPLDIDSVVPVNRMTGQNEKRVTYPRFFTGPSGQLIFSYRDGSSGNGNNLLNVYDPATQTWRRLLDAPLMDGRGHMNAYMDGPLPGPDGWFHVSWVWRNSPDASTCHDLSYMRSRDLVHWETVDGKPLSLPITMATPGVIVDPIPVRGGILNGQEHVGFDQNGQLVLSYIKYDANGKTQLYFARYANGEWNRIQATHWHVRFEFNGGGSLPTTGVHIGTLAWEEGRLTIALTQTEVGGGTWSVDPQTMQLQKKLPPDPLALALHTIGRPESKFPGMRTSWSADLGVSEANVTYRLRWEALPPNRDKPRQPPFPPPSMLRLVRVTL